MSDDTISRQAAIDALDEIEAEVANGYGYQYAKWREYFVEMPSAQQWIPCSERLPEKNKMDSTGEFREAYLVTTGHQMFTARFNENGWWVLWGYPQVLRNIVAWMPLPEPYKGEQE